MEIVISPTSPPLRQQPPLDFVGIPTSSATSSSAGDVSVPIFPSSCALAGVQCGPSPSWAPALDHELQGDASGRWRRGLSFSREALFANARHALRYAFSPSPQTLLARCSTKCLSRMNCPYSPCSITTNKTLTLPQNSKTQLLITLNSQLSHLTNSHQHLKALLLFTQLHSSPSLSISPDHYTFSTALKSCAAHLRFRSLGAQLHSLAVRTGLAAFSHVSNSLLSFYSKTHSPELAQKLFSSIPSPDVYSYTTLLSAYVKSGQFENALHLFDEIPERNTPVWNAMITGFASRGCRGLAVELFGRMHRMGIGFDRYTFAGVLSSCGSVEFGRQIHSTVIRTGFVEFSVAVVNALVTMYFDCGAVGDGVTVFQEAKLCDVITYNGLIAGLVRWEMDEEALMVFKGLIREVHLRPTELTFVSVLSAYSLKEIPEQVYVYAIKMGFEDSSLVGNAALTMYSHSRDLASARNVFEKIHDKDAVSWNSMISGYSQENMHESAIELYRQMLRAGMEPDEFTYGSLLACSPVAKHAQVIQAVVLKTASITFTEVGNALISAYAKFEEIDSANQIFNEMSFKNLISWNSIISGSLLNGFPMDGLQSFTNLLNSGLEPNSYTLCTVLSTCATISTLKLGEQIHSYILKSWCDFETALGNSLITMYAKCGDLHSSSEVFSGMRRRDVVSWNAIIAAYSQNGDGHGAVYYFKLMQKSEILPDHATFTILLSACSHAGMVEEGHLIFISMIRDYGIEPQVDHYSCMIDLLSRAGLLDDAERLISSMPSGANSHTWWTVLSACSTYGNAKLGKIAAEFLLEMEPDNTAVYVLLSNINAAQGKWEEASSVREQMRNKCVVKKPGCSWIESENNSTDFTVLYRTTLQLILWGQAEFHLNEVLTPSTLRVTDLLQCSTELVLV